MLAATKSFIATFILMALSLWAYHTPTFQEYKAEASGRFSFYLEKIMLPYRMADLSSYEPDMKLVIPVEGLQLRQIAESWGAPRPGNRQHEGIDIFAKKGLRSFLLRMDTS